MLQNIPGIRLIAEDEVYDEDLGENYITRLFDFLGHIIEITEDAHGYNAKAEGGMSRVRMDEGGLIGFILDLFGLR